MKNNIWLQPGRQMNGGAIVSGMGFLLYLGASALGWEIAALILAILFGLAALYVFLSALMGRGRDRESVSYSIMWGTGALTLLLLGCAVLTIKLWLGLL